MKINLFDKFISDKMNGYKPSVSPHIWENIAKEKERKPIIFWLSPLGKAAIVFLIAASFSSAAYLFMHKNNMINKIVQQQKIENKLNKITLETDNSHTNNNATKYNVNAATSSSTAFIKQVNSNTKPSFKFTRATAQLDTDNNYLTATLETNDDKDNDNYLKQNSINIVELLFINRKLSNHIILKPLFAAPSIPCPESEKNAAGGKRYFEIYAGPDYAFNTYEDTGINYIEKRKASTGFKYAVSAGIRYTKVFDNGISIRTGLNYSQINEDFFAKNGYTLSHVYTVNGSGDTTSNFLVSTPQYEKSTNVYKTIDIPIQLGYELGNGKWHSNISAGVMVNIMNKQTGKVVDKNGLAVDISSNKTNSVYQYKTSAGISFLGSASAYYKINDNLHAMVEPYIKLGLSSVTKQDITLKQKNNTVGLRVGLRYDF